MNLYSLFVERAMTIVKRSGMVGLVTPSGIASDQTAAIFFKGVATGGRLKALYDFENKKVFFPDVHASFKFCVFVASPTPIGGETRCAFYLHSISELRDPERCFPLTAADFARVNPITGTAPIFRSRRDAALVTAIYSRVPILDQSGQTETQEWPIKFATFFHMSNNSQLFRTKEELEEREHAWPLSNNTWQSDTNAWVPLYQGRSLEAYDHRFAGVEFNPANIRRGYVSVTATLEQHKDPDFQIKFQYFVPQNALPSDINQGYLVAFRRSTATTNARTMVSAISPFVGYGDSLFLLVPDENLPTTEWPQIVSELQGNLMSTIFDFIARNKLHGQNFSWYILKQLPFVPPTRLRARSLRDQNRE